VRDADLLTECLAEIEDRGWDLQALLVERADLSSEIRASLRAAQTVRLCPPPAVSDAFRARSRTRLISFIQAEAICARSRSPVERLRDALSPIFGRLVAPGAAALFLVVGTAGAWSASASALPSAPLYPAKVAFEQLRVLAALTPDQQAAAHLSNAAARLHEANVELASGHGDTASRLLQSYDREVSAALSALNAPRLDAIDQQSPLGRELAALALQRSQFASLIAPSSPPVGARRTAQADPTASSAAQPPTSPAATFSPPVVLSPGREPAATEVPTATDLGEAAPARSAASGSSAAPGGAAAGAAPVAAPAAPATTSPAPVPVGNPADRLVRTLIAQAMVGDSSGALATAQQISALLRNLPRSEGLLQQWQGEPKKLQAALPAAPATTQPALVLALNAINQFLAPAPNHVAPVVGATDNPPRNVAPVPARMPVIPSGSGHPAPVIGTAPVSGHPGGTPQPGGPTPVSPTKGNPVIGTPRPGTPISVHAPAPPTVMTMGPVVRRGKPIPLGKGTILTPAPPKKHAPPPAPPSRGKGKHPTR
jgi:Domain of unknown function (DUF5667)